MSVLTEDLVDDTRTDVHLRGFEDVCNFFLNSVWQSGTADSIHLSSLSQCGSNNSVLDTFYCQFHFFVKLHLHME